MTLGIKEEVQPVAEKTATAIPASKSKPKTFEKYRKSYFCPIGGCQSGHALKKISNHLTDVHHIMDKTRRKELLAQAKEAGPVKSGQRKVTITLDNFLQKKEASTPKTLVLPSVKSKHGSTKHYPRYNIDKEPLIMAFIANLCTADGGLREHNVARDIASDVSKFLAFANMEVCTFESLLNIEKLKAFLAHLEESGIGPDGITTKLDNIETAMKYVRRERLIIDFPQSLIDRISLWKTSFKKKKPALEIERQMQPPAQNTLLQVREFFENATLIKEMADIESKIVKNENLSDPEITQLVTYLFMCLAYKNWQRPSAIIRMTLSEAHSFSEKDDKLLLQCRAHKTGQTYGPAVMVLEGHDIELWKLYFKKVRPTIQGANELKDIAIITSSGSPLTHYRDLVISLTNRLGITSFPNITTVRKAGATEAVSSLTDESMEKISEHMSHSKSTSERYYRMRNRHSSAIAAFVDIKTITGKVNISTLCIVLFPHRCLQFERRTQKGFF